MGASSVSYCVVDGGGAGGGSCVSGGGVSCWHSDEAVGEE